MAMTLNHGETFGVFCDWGDILDDSQALQGIFFEGSRHISLMRFEVYGHNLQLLNSAIREDNDSMALNFGNKHSECPGTAEFTLHVSKKRSIVNEAYHETITFKNFNSSSMGVSGSARFDADFKDVFELRGFSRPRPAGEPLAEVREDRLAFVCVGADGIERATWISCQGACAGADGKCFEFSFELQPGESKELSFCARFKRDVPQEKRYLFEGELSRKLLSLDGLKSKFPKIETNNAHFNHWINRSALDITTLMSCYGDNLYPMAGVPWYNTPFGRDGMITAIQTLVAIPFIAKNVLLFLSHYQAKHRDDKADSEPGKILHELRKGELANIGALPFKKYYGAVDSTFLFIWLAGLYFRRTRDEKTLRALLPALNAALEWANESADLDGDGFYEYSKRNPAGLDNQCWKDSWDSISLADGKLAKPPLALCEVQGYAYQAFVQAAFLLRHMGEKKRADEYRKKAKRLKRFFNKRFWQEDMGFFALALDQNKRPCRVFSSNPGHCLSTGIMDRDKAKIVSQRLFEDDLFSGWGIRTLGRNEKRYNPMSYHNGSIWPHDNSMIARGLKLYGEDEQFEKLFDSMYEATLHMELQRLPELFCGFERSPNEPPIFYPVSCSPQAWASGVVFLLVESMLGLEINALERKAVFECPKLPVFLHWIKIEGLTLEDGANLSFIANRTSSGEVTLEVLEKPANWRVSIEK